MAKVSLHGFEEYIGALGTLRGNITTDICGPAIYEGAGIVADEIRARIEAIPTDDRHGTPEDPLKGPMSFEKEAMLERFGVSRIRMDDGFYNVRLGFTGYTRRTTHRWPSGIPVAMIARSVNRGTSFMRANPFIKSAVNKKRKECVKRMSEVVDQKIAETVPTLNFQQIQAYRNSLKRQRTD